MRTNIKTYSFLTTDSFRVDVKASSPKAAYNKLKSIPFHVDKITKSYIVYGKDGLASLDGWRALNI